jgi:purine-cytosine permease-like protein
MTSNESHHTLVERLDALYEYDREPVSKKKLHGHKTFIAMFSGEHVAGTEFVLGPLMLAHGVTAKDFLGGLLVGNLLAVLSWALLCAPVAVRTRLTIYWQLRKMCGPYLTVAYSIFYAVILCLLAGAMVTVSVTAVSLIFPGIQNPGPQDMLPSVPWMLLALVVGSVIAVLAVLGFERLAQFSKICAPWMALVFVAAGLAVLPSLGVHSFSDIWPAFKDRIFTGEPLPGFSKYTFWHVMGFAWLCNATQHIGMSDITIFRYAKSWKSGFASAFGMYIGHFIAWIASAILCAAALGNQTPGEIALLGAGFAGAVCVVIAGWTTANPTLYRAGLAIQVATPNWQRWKVTFAAGAFMVVTACIPEVNRNLDRIVGYYGLFFMPLGACIFIDVWILPRLGMVSNYVEKTGRLLSWPALCAWVISFGFSFFLYGKDQYMWMNNLIAPWQPQWLENIQADLLFLVAPEWILAVSIYLVLSWWQQKQQPYTPEVTSQQA